VLTTLSTVKDELQITVNTHDSTLERYITQASDLFRSTTGRNFHNVTDHTEKVDGERGKRLTVREHLPIDTIDKIELDVGTTVETIASNDYEIEDPNLGYIRRISGHWQSTDSFINSIEPRPLNEDLKLYKVTYDGGYVTPEQANQTPKVRDLPADIEQGVIDQVVKMYTERGKNPNVVSESVMSASVDYAKQSNADSRIPPGVAPTFANVANKYKAAEVMIA